MCVSGSQSGCCCCPSAQIFKEELCGNLTGPLEGFEAWTAPIGMNDYIQGTFEIFNAGPGVITATISGTPDANLNVPPGSSQAVGVINPSEMVVTVPAGTSGKFCINLFKRLFP